MITDPEILSILSANLADADQNINYERPLNYYLGNVAAEDCVDGKSSVVSTDVADAIEWIMPQIMKSFTQNNEVVIFDPVHQGDEKQAEIESEYVYEVLMKQNDGFIILHQFVKDALMQGNGFIKVYYENTNEVKTTSYTGIPFQQFQALLADPRIEIVSKTVKEVFDPNTQSYIPIVDSKLSITIPNGRIIVESVAPENFRVNSDHNSISLDEARFTSHLALKTKSDLIEEGYDAEVINQIGTDPDYDESEYRFSAQNEHYFSSLNTDDSSMDLIQVSESFMWMDIDDDGIAEYVKIVAAGHNIPTDLLSIEEIDCSPWVSVTAILMSHKLRGLSIYDRLRQIQEQKTALLRNIMDNVYIHNNQRHLVVENQVRINDMLVSRPAGIVRVKRIDAVAPLPNPPLPNGAFDMMNYFDTVRAGRVGVSPEGEASPQNIGDRIGSEGLERLMNAKEELVGLIIRVVAETGVKPLCVKIRDLCTSHIDAVKDFQFKGQWVQVNPADWPNRSHCTVRVGTGTGNHQQQIGAIQQIIKLQSELQAVPGQTLVSPDKVYASMDAFCKFTGLNGANPYFLDPSSPEGQQAAQQTQQKMQEEQQKGDQQNAMMLESQVKMANAELQKAGAQMENVQLKNQVDRGKNQLQFYKQQADAQMAMLQQQLDEAKAALDAAKTGQDMEFKEKELLAKTTIDLTKLEVESQKQQDENYKENKETANDNS